MIHLLVLAVAALHLQDPAGDAVGDGTLAPPTAPVYANTADFDLQSVTLTSDPKLTVRVQLGAVSDAAGLPNGFSNPILEVYLDTEPGGAQQLLPGSSMAMPPKHGWEIALRATGDEAYAVEAQSGGSPASWPRLPVTVDVQGNTITLHTQIPRPGRADVYALTGVYDPFTADGWRPLTSSVSPWAFSSASQQVPVVDLLASSQSAQRREIDSGVLSPFRSPLHGLGWLVLMVLGLITAAAGLVLRRRVRAPERPSPKAAREAANAPDAVGTSPARRDAAPARADGSRPDEDGAADAIHERFLDEEEEAELWPDAEASVDRAVAGAAAGVTGAALAGGTEHGAEGTASEVAAEAAGETTGREDTAGEDTAVEDTADEDTADENTAREETAREDTAAEDTTGEGTAAEDTAVEDTADEGATDESAAREGAAGEGAAGGADDGDGAEAPDARGDEAPEDEAQEDEADAGPVPGSRRP